MFCQDYNSYGAISSDPIIGATEGFLTTLIVIVAVYAFVVLVIWGLFVAGLWKTLEKAGEKGWKALIPFYNIYALIKATWKNEWIFWAYLGMIFANYFIVFIFTLIPFGEFFSYPASYFISEAVVAINALIFIKVGKAFGCSNAFIVGLILLSPIFLLILGFSKEYQFVRVQSSEL